MVCLWQIIVLGFCCCFVQGTLLGGRNKVNLDDSSELEHITRLALFGVKSIAQQRAKAEANLGNTFEAKYSLMNITSANKQLVAGVNYFLTIEMQPEECASLKDNDEVASSADPLMCELKHEECDMTIWEKVWLNSTELTEFECKTRRVVNNLGARHRIDNEDESARHALDFAIAEMNKFYKHAVYYIPLVQNTYKQIVNGIKYTFEFEYAPTSCLVSEENMDDLRNEQCKVDTEKNSMSCVVTVLDQFWLADEQETNDSASEPVYTVDKPNRYHVTLKNCT